MPYLGTLFVAILAVIDAKRRTKHTAQTFGELGGEHNLRQEIQHLLATCDSLLNETDVDFGLAG